MLPGQGAGLHKYACSLYLVMEVSYQAGIENEKPTRFQTIPMIGILPIVAIAVKLP